MEQPGIDSRKRLNDILQAKKETVRVGRRTFRIGWLKHGTMRKFTDVMLEGEDEGYRRNVKLAAIVLLNSKWKMWLYPLYWRWLYYLRDMDAADVLAVIDAAKKKLPHEAYLMSTILATGMMDTMMTMRREEVRSGQAGQAGAPDTR